MAAAIKALNARIRSNPVTDYLCSTHFWGPASNFGIPIAAVMDTYKDADIISGRMTLALCGYSAVFMRYAFAVTPKNYLLFGCHIVNFSAQSTQMYRFLNYWHFGGKESAAEKAKQEMKEVGGLIDQEAKRIGDEAAKTVKTAVDKVKGS